MEVVGRVGQEREVDRLGGGIGQVVGRTVDAVEAEADVVGVEVGCVDTEVTEGLVGDLRTTALAEKCG